MSTADVTKILERLASIEAKLDGRDDHENRLRSLEQWRSGLAGVLALVVLELQAVTVFITYSRL